MMTDAELLLKVKVMAIGMSFNNRHLVLELVNRYKTAKAEIERLQKFEFAPKGYSLKRSLEIPDIKAEAIKEFAEQVEEALLNKKLLTRDDIPVIIKNLVKERLGDDSDV